MEKYFNFNISQTETTRFKKEMFHFLNASKAASSCSIPNTFFKLLNHLSHLALYFFLLCLLNSLTLKQLFRYIRTIKSNQFFGIKPLCTQSQMLFVHTQSSIRQLKHIFAFIWRAIFILQKDFKVNNDFFVSGRERKRTKKGARFYFCC